MIGVPIQALESTSEMAMTPIMHTIGVPIQALKSTSEMAMTPMGHQEEEAPADPNTAGVDHLRATYHDHLLLVVKAMVIGLICMLW